MTGKSKFGSRESRELYDELCAAWLSQQDASRIVLLVDDLCLLYMDHVVHHYRKNSVPTSEVACQKLALRWLVRIHGQTRVAEFGPRRLKEVRKAMVEAGYVRNSINAHVGRIRRMFRWGVEEELVNVGIYESLKAVSGLQEGRSQARESVPVRPVFSEDVEATLSHLPETVADMVKLKLQLLTGCRPGEICRIRPCDISSGSTDSTWCYRPLSHKTQHHGHERRVYIGPNGQQILSRYMHRAPDAYCFSPAESVRRQSMQNDDAHRAKNGCKLRKFNDHYTKDSYNRCIRRACLKANVRPWSPNQLRHARATTIRAEFGIEAAQVVLGHANPNTTLIYAETQFDQAAHIARKTG